MCLEEQEDSAVWSMGLLDADHGKCVGSPYHTPLQDHRQSVSLHLFSVTAQTYSEFFTLSCSLNQFAYSHFSFLHHHCEFSPNSFHPFFPMVTFLSALQFSVSFLPSFLVVQQFPVSLFFPLFLVVQQFFLAAFPIFLCSVPLTFEDMPPCWYKTFCNSELSITCHPQLLKSFLLPLATQ